jgi:hypothetical protein
MLSRALRLEAKYQGKRAGDQGLNAPEKYQMATENRLSESRKYETLNWVTKIININSRGVLTLPKEMRRRMGVVGPAQIIAEETDDGIKLRPKMTFPIEIYSRKKIG